LSLAAAAQEHAAPPELLASWVGRQAPAGLALLDAAVGSGRAVVLHFTGDAGPDNIAQAITLNKLRERYGNEIVFLRAENETTEGDRVFESFGASRIPSIVVLDPGGVVSATFEGPTAEEALARAIDAARSRSPAAKRPGGLPTSVYDLAAPLPTPVHMVGRSASPSTAALRAALTGEVPVLIAFVGGFSRFDSEQSRILDAVAAEHLVGLRVVRVSAEEGSNEPAFHDYRVTGVPTTVVASAGGVVAAVVNGLADRDALEAAVAAAEAFQSPGPAGPGGAGAADGAPIVGGGEHVVLVQPGPPAEGDGAAGGATGPGNGEGDASGQPPQPPPGGATDPTRVGPPLAGPEPSPAAQARSGLEAEGGDPENLLSPASGARLTVSSAVNDDYGASRLVDGLVDTAPGFRPWVTSTKDQPPFSIEAAFPTARRISAIEVVARTGDPKLFGKRWPKELEVLCRMPGSSELERWAAIAVPASGEPVAVELDPRMVEGLAIRVLSTQGGGRACELAELRAR
jgi:hypothetical protein